MRIQALRCHVIYCHNGTKLHVIPVLASRSQALRYFNCMAVVVKQIGTFQQLWDHMTHLCNCFDMLYLLYNFVTELSRFSIFTSCGDC